MSPGSIRPRFLVALTVVLVLLLGTSLLSAYLHVRNRAHQVRKARTDEVEKLLELHLREDAAMLNAALVAMSQDDRLRAGLVARRRDLLLERATPLFRRLHRELEVSHLYFTGPDRVNLLRVHKPDRHGDVIDRFTTREAERTGKPAHGVELGPLGTMTQRVVHPWFEGERLIGFVELGYEVGHVTELMGRTMNAGVWILIKKKFLERRGWEAGMGMLERRARWDQFPDAVAINEIPEAMPRSVVRLLATGGLEHAPPELDVESAGRDYYLAIRPLLDVEGRDVGRQVLIWDVTDTVHASVRLILSVAVIGFAVCGLLFVLGCFWAGQVERRRGQER